MESPTAAGKLPRVRSKRHRRLRSHKLVATLIVLIVLVSLGGATDLGYASLKAQADHLQANLTSKLQAGQQELEAGSDALKQANAKHDTSFVTQAIAHFAAAKANFVTAGQLADNSKLLRYLKYVPSVGDFVRSRHSAVHGIAEMGVAVSDAGQHLSDLDAELIRPSVSGSAGRTLLTVLQQTQTGLTSVRGDFARAQEAAQQVDLRVVPSAQQAAFIRARDTITEALAGLDEFDRLVPVLVEVLGGRGARTYLVEQVNPIELRAGGGFIGSYSLLRADNGSLAVDRSGDSYELADPRPLLWQRGFIAQPSPYREVIPNVSWSFVDSNLFPDFPSNARAAEQFVEPRTGTIDGVISIDFYAVASMLEITGPLAVPGYNLTVDSGNLVQTLIALDLNGSPVRKAVLAALAGPLMDRVSKLSPNRWLALLGALNGLASGHHLQVYLNDPAAEAELTRVGWSGTLNPISSSDFMMEVEDNYGSKANAYVSRNITVELARRGGLLHHKITIELTNSTPYGSQDRTYYHAVIRLYTGEAISSPTSSLSPTRYANPDPPANTRLIDGWVFVPCCGSRKAVLVEYDTPWSVRDRGVHQIYWQKQPGTVRDSIKVFWTDADGHSYAVDGNLAEDRVITVKPGSVTLIPGKLADATLATIGL